MTAWSSGAMADDQPAQRFKLNGCTQAD